MSEPSLKDIIQSVLDRLDSLISDPLWTDDERSLVAYYLTTKPLERIPDIIENAISKPIKRKLLGPDKLDDLYFSYEDNSEPGNAIYITTRRKFLKSPNTLMGNMRAIKRRRSLSGNWII